MSVSKAAVPAAVVVVVEVDVVAGLDRATAADARPPDGVEHELRPDRAVLAPVAAHESAAFHADSSIVAQPPSRRSFHVLQYARANSAVGSATASARITSIGT